MADAERQTVVTRLLARLRGAEPAGPDTGRRSSFTAHHPPQLPQSHRAAPTDAWIEPAATPVAATAAEPSDDRGVEEASDDLQARVHADAIARSEPRPRGNAPNVHVYDERLDDRPGPVELTPSQAIELAREGPEALRRRGSA
ncbi:MAG: hypothetical protein M3N57_13400 [Actinomycetota bacterium]|nr:hypothetical protein [Actinomycetota bacterium]